MPIRPSAATAASPTRFAVLEAAGPLAERALPLAGRGRDHAGGEPRERAAAARRPIGGERQQRVERDARGQVLAADVPEPVQVAAQQERLLERRRVAGARARGEPVRSPRARLALSRAARAAWPRAARAAEVDGDPRRERDGSSRRGRGGSPRPRRWRGAARRRRRGSSRAARSARRRPRRARAPSRPASRARRARGGARRPRSRPAPSPRASSPRGSTESRRSSRCSCGVEERVAPADRRAQRALAERQVAIARGEQVEGVVEPLEQRRGLEDAHAGGGQLEGERQAVEPAADRGDRPRRSRRSARSRA